MREIKFRAWDKNRSKWLRDFAVYENGNLLTWNETNNCYSIDKDNNFIDIQQCVGWRDKNGKELFEGDFVDDGDTVNSAGVVKWYPENSSFGIDGYIQITRGMAARLEIIGNIYENPELLKPTR